MDWVVDPELCLNHRTLVYELRGENARVMMKMTTVTKPACPVPGNLPEMAGAAVIGATDGQVGADVGDASSAVERCDDDRGRIVDFRVPGPLSSR
ncbi:MAG: hypothetical protein ACRDQH_13770 [Pseudonocardiaceae bacterium]